ncbi:chain-length determining protein [Pseudomonas yamanorum]|uniref:Wzz/FepE/Etk N-terminal domain-containing protein n=1 Tax=Pseudomonas yamanorum TaxID=515393 RepID=UPI00159FBF21|nr:chain-length determining protein [Pseudomonas yamanorum]
MSSSFRISPVTPSDQIDLFDFSHFIWQKKNWILIAVACAGLISGAYAFLSKPEYRVDSVLRPAAINELDSLNRSDIYLLSSESALIKVGASLESYETRLGFFRANPKLFEQFVKPGQSLEQSFEEFNKDSINIISPNLRKANELSSNLRVELTFPGGVDGVSILNGLVSYAINTERAQVSADLQVIVNNRLNELKGKYEAARKSYEADKEVRIAKLVEADQLRRLQLQDELKALRNQLKTLRANHLSQLNEAIFIAKTLGILKPSTQSSFADGDRASNIMRTEVNSQQLPLYFMGTEALEAERSAIKQRKSDDFTEGRIAQIAKELQLLEVNREVEILNSRTNEEVFLSGVEPLRAEMTRLQNLSQDMASLKLVVIDQQASEPRSPVKPRKALVITFGLFLGLVFGLLFVGYLYLFRNHGNSTSMSITELDERAQALALDEPRYRK